MKSTLILLVTIGLLAGCETTSPKNTASAVPQVEVFRDGQSPTRSFKLLTILTDDGTEGEESEIQDKMIKKAKRLGASAVIFEPLKESGFEVAPFSFQAKKTYIYKAKVVTYE